MQTSNDLAPIGPSRFGFCS